MIDTFETKRIRIVLNRDSASTYSVSLYSLIDDKEQHIHNLKESEAIHVFECNVRWYR